MLIKIYYLTKKDNIPFYIGKTKNDLVYRHRHHRFHLKNKDIKIHTIDEVEEVDWKYWESYWIEQFKCWGFDLTNKNSGGGGPHIFSDEHITKLKNKVITKATKKKMSDSRKGHPMYTTEWREAISKAKKGKPNPKLREAILGKPKIKKAWKIKQFDVYYNYIGAYISAKEAGKHLNQNAQSIRDAASGRQKTAYGFIWEYDKQKNMTSVGITLIIGLGLISIWVYLGERQLGIPKNPSYIDDSTNKAMIGIYKLTNPKGKVYIGQSIKIEDRIKSYEKPKDYAVGRMLLYSLQKYGLKKHKVEILEECSRKQLNDREIFWIAEYNSVKEGLNIDSGGLGFKRSKDTKDRIRKGKIGKNAKKITQYTKTLDFVKVWHSIREAEDEYGKGIKGVLARKTYTAGGFVWRYEGEVVDYNDLPPKQHHNNKPIIQYDLEGNKIKEWNSRIEVERVLGFNSSNISMSMVKPNLTAFGYRWKKKIK